MSDESNPGRKRAALYRSLFAEDQARRDEVKRLRVELEDVRQQRETLKVECEALAEALQRMTAEVERRGEMLTRAGESIRFLLEIADKYQERINYGSRWDILELASEIESLDHAPAQPERGTDDD